MFDEYPDIMTPADVSTALGVSENSVYLLLRNRELGYRRVGRRIIIPKICLIDFVQSARMTNSET